MKKDTKETIYAIIILILVFLSGYYFGNQIDENNSEQYNNGLSDGFSIKNGDKWDCAYSYSTGFIMCDRNPKYKD